MVASSLSGALLALAPSAAGAWPAPRVAQVEPGEAGAPNGRAAEEPAATPDPTGPTGPTGASDPPGPSEPADAAAAAAAAAAPGDEASIDLDMLDLGATGGFDDSLHLYGFADFTWMSLRSRTAAIPKTTSFGVGKLNVYLRKELTPRWRSLAEVRFLFAPNGAIAQDGSFIDTAVSDSANFERAIRWGGISIERAYLEYDVARWLTVRAGRWLTPYGIWNIDHGSPTIIGASRPYMVGEQFFPESQTGLAAFGARPFGESTLEYHLTLSNGRNFYEATRDPDSSPAVGGRLAYETPMAGKLRLGASAYFGRATEAVRTGAPSVEYKELALGADLSWDRDGLHVQSELLVQQRQYEEGQRPMRLGGGYAPDATSWGVYGLAGYRFAALGHVMPYVFVGRYHAIDPTLFGDVFDVAGGLNLRPIPAVTLKAELLFASFSGGGIYGDRDLDVLRFQSAWVF